MLPDLERLILVPHALVDVHGFVRLVVEQVVEDQPRLRSGIFHTLRQVLAIGVTTGLQVWTKPLVVLHTLLVVHQDVVGFQQHAHLRFSPLRAF